MRWIHNVWFICIASLVGVFLVAFGVWMATGPAKSDELPAWLVPTIVMPDGLRVTGADGWHPLRYPSMPACRQQRNFARTLAPPPWAAEILWECLPYNPFEGRGHDTV